MKLREYLENQQHQMPELDKLIVYEKVRQHMEKESIFTKVSFYTKVAVYSLFLLFVFFGIFYHQQQITPGIKVATNTVFADYIGKIITSTGEFQILENWNPIQSKFIKKWDILQLSKSSHLTLQVNQGIKLYIVWPAKIQLDNYTDSNWKEIYVVNMVDWDYISVKSNSAKDKIVIKSKYFNIESNDNLIDLKYEKKWNATIIENNGWNIIIKNNSKVLSLDKQEKLIVLSNDDINHIKNIFSDNYKKYQLTMSGNLKEVITSKQINQLSNILNKTSVILATWKFVLGKLNNDQSREESGKKQLIQIITSTYKILKIQIPTLLNTKIQNNQLTVVDLENLIDYLLTQIENKYVIPEQFVKRLKVILAYLVIVEKVKVQPGQTFPNLSYLVNYLKLDKKYKKMLLTF